MRLGVCTYRTEGVVEHATACGVGEGRTVNVTEDHLERAAEKKKQEEGVSARSQAVDAMVEW